MLLPAVVPAGPVFTTDKSAAVTMEVVSFGPLSSERRSGGLDVTRGEFEMDPPPDTLGLTLTTNVNVAVAPAANVVPAAVAVPVAPTAGVVRVKAGPAV